MLIKIGRCTKSRTQNNGTIAPRDFLTPDLDRPITFMSPDINPER
ncbi:hypothetical protein ACKFKG_05420 [Phormidesmis sp. 146-35]